jgi:hypothetical protein
MIKDCNLELSTQWRTNVGAGIGGVAPTDYQYEPLPSPLGSWMEFYTNGPAYSDVLFGLTRPIMPNTGILSLQFDLVVSPESLTVAQALEFDVVLIGPDLFKYLFGMQIAYIGGGVLQISNPAGAWQGTNITTGKLSLETVHHVQCLYSFDFATHAYTFLAVSIDDQAYTIPAGVGSMTAALSNWAPNIAIVQVQLDIGASGGTYRTWMKNLELVWE